jgi:hypothetical protein
MEESMFGTRAERSARSGETADIVVGRQTGLRGRRAISSTVHGGRRHYVGCQKRLVFFDSKMSVIDVYGGG